MITIRYFTRWVKNHFHPVGWIRSKWRFLRCQKIEATSSQFWGVLEMVGDDFRNGVVILDGLGAPEAAAHRGYLELGIPGICKKIAKGNGRVAIVWNGK